MICIPFRIKGNKPNFAKKTTKSVYLQPLEWGDSERMLKERIENQTVKAKALLSRRNGPPLIGADGRLVHVWKSNAWTPYEVQRMIKESASGPKLFSAIR